jgi:hypothetical protein
VFWGDNFIFGLITQPKHFNLNEFKKVLGELGNAEDVVKSKLKLIEKLQAGKGKVNSFITQEKIVIEGALKFVFTANVKDNDKKLEGFFKNLGYVFN